MHPGPGILTQVILLSCILIAKLFQKQTFVLTAKAAKRAKNTTSKFEGEQINWITYTSRTLLFLGGLGALGG